MNLWPGSFKSRLDFLKFWTCINFEQHWIFLILGVKVEVMWSPNFIVMICLIHFIEPYAMMYLKINEKTIKTFWLRYSKYLCPLKISLLMIITFLAIILHQNPRRWLHGFTHMWLSKVLYWLNKVGCVFALVVVYTASCGIQTKWPSGRYTPLYLK